MPIFDPISATEIILSFVVFMANSYLGLAVLLHNPKSWTSRLFALLAVVLNMYVFVNLFSLYPPLGTPENQLFWIKIVIVVAAFIGPLLFLLAHTFPHKNISLSKKYIIPIFALAILTALAGAYGYIFESINYPEGQPVPTPGKGMALFALDFPLLVIASFVVLINKFRRARGEEKAKLAYFMLGILGTFTLMVIATITLVVIFKTPKGIFLGPIFPVILMFAVTYAIIRHRFLDIRPIIARAVSYTVFIIVFAAIYAFLLISITKRFLGFSVELSTMAIFLALTIIAMISFRYLEEPVGKITNKLFFKRHYDREKLLSKLTHAMAENIDLGLMSRNIFDILIAQMNVSKVAFLIIENHKIVEIKQLHFADLSQEMVKLEELFHNPIESGLRTILFEDLKESVLKSIFRKFDISVAIPIEVEAQEVALLIVGSKMSGEPYYKTDVEVLDIFAQEAGIAIQNAKAFEEIKKFSQELEKRVAERTQELKETQEGELAKAREVSKLKDEFVFVAAHELRAPASVIKGYVSMVLDGDAGKLTNKIKEFLTEAARANEQLLQLVSDLLEIARSDAGRIKIDVSSVDLPKNIDTVLSEVKPLLDEKKIKIHYEQPQTSIFVAADTSRVKEVLLNFVTNAIKYNKNSGLVRIYHEDNGQDIITHVEDSGIGIPQDEQNKIFEKFFRSESEKMQGITGTGLGLFISKELIERMGGKIFFRSEETKGSTFSFSLKKTSGTIPV